ncbi:MAG: chromate transporter, partial [Ezakiella massiliensis]
MDNFLILIIEFFKAGLFAVGGGLATIPFLVEIGNKYGFFTYQELLTMIGVSESTPGAIGINMATYVGIKVEGFWGGVVATLSLVAPSLIIIILIARVIN